MPRVAITLETAALARVGMPIVAVASYDIEREINSAGSWTLEFPASEALASQVRSRWRVSIVEEGRAGYLLYRGIVTDREFTTGRDGGGMLTLAGFTRLFGLTNQTTHLGLRFGGDVSILDIASTLAGETVTAPTVPDIAIRRPIVTFNDTSKLAALLTALEYARLNVRETFDHDGFELVAWDNVPDSGYRFITVDQAGPDLERAAANGVGLIAGSPRIGYNGRDLATRIIPVGVDHDGSPLTLASSALAIPYPIRTGSNPDGSIYYYLQDDDAVDATELVEMQLVRSDIKNPNDNSVSRALAATALYAVGAGTLIQRKSDMIAFSSEIANGAQIDALPGSRVRIQFRGRAASFGGGGNYWSLDDWFLINKRRDFSSNGGVRGVSFTLTAPEVPLRIPTLPNEIVIPPPSSDPPSPRGDGGFAGQEGTEADDSGGEDEAALETPEDTVPLDPVPQEPPGGGIVTPKPPMPPKKLVPPEKERGAYQPCCPDPTTINEGGDTPPPNIGGGGAGWTDITYENGNPIVLSGAPAPTQCYVLVQLSNLGDPPGISGEGVNIQQVASFDFQSRLYEGNPEEGDTGYEHIFVKMFTVTTTEDPDPLPGRVAPSLSGNVHWRAIITAEEPLTGVTASCTPSYVENLSFVYSEAEQMELTCSSGGAPDMKSALVAWCFFGTSFLFYDNPWSNDADKVSVHHMLGVNRGAGKGVQGNMEVARGPVADPTIRVDFWYRGPTGGTGGKWGVGGAIVNVTPS